MHRLGGPRRTHAEALQLVKDGGFHYTDINLESRDPNENPVLAPDPKKAAEDLRALCGKVGLIPDQAHANFDFRSYSPADITRELLTTVDVCGDMGIDKLVVHADTWYDAGNYEFYRVLNHIYDIHAPVVERAKQRNVRIAMETLFEDPADGGKRSRFCSRLEELDALVSKFNDKSVGICWDFGHARVTYGDDQFRMMRLVGNKIIATHVHDNFYGQDLHLFPFMGLTKWSDAFNALRDIGYTDSFTFELVYDRLPDELMPDYITFLRKAGEYMIHSIGQTVTP